MMLTLPSDIEIAASVTPRPIVDVARDVGLAPDDIELYGKYKAKLPLDVASRPARGRLVLVTAINPTPAGEGKSTVAVGLSQALRRLNVNAILCMREPSLGPVFGVKGGAAGGGYSQVIPMADINLHFTGDFHAIASAHALLSAAPIPARALAISRRSSGDSPSRASHRERPPVRRPRRRRHQPLHGGHGGGAVAGQRLRREARRPRRAVRGLGEGRRRSTCPEKGDSPLFGSRKRGQPPLIARRQKSRRHEY